MSTSNSKTKKLPPGVTFASSDGTVSGLTIAELAKQVGKELGVQRVAYPSAMSGGQWYRVASLSQNSFCSAIFMLGHKWGSGTPAGLTFSLNATASGSSKVGSLKQISGSAETLPKVRYVRENTSGDSGNQWIDVFVEDSKSIALKIAVFSNGGVDLLESATIAPDVEGFKVTELTVTDMWGG